MKYSLRRQMTAVFIGLLVFILGAVFIVNSGFLEEYYISHKEQDLLETYQVVGGALQDETLTAQAVQEIAYQAEKANIDMTVINSRNETVLATVKDGNPLYNQMYRNIFNRNESPRTVLKRNTDYIIYKTTDPENDTEYLEMWGSFSDGFFFTMRSPLASIRESAALANQFLIYLGVTGVILGGILVWLFARKITKPIMELAKLSESMADLNFDERYTSGGSNEIGILGENFNKMSRQLEKTISELKRANNQLQQDIEQKEKMEDMRNEFLGNVSHELKTPLALIQGYAEGLKEGVSDEMRARILATAREMGYQRLVVAFQPHTYTRTAKLFDRFVEELKIPDVAILAEIFAAREQNTLGISSADLCRNIPGAVYCSTLDKVAEALRQAARPGDLILTVGAGDIYRAGEKLLEKD